MTSFIGCFPAVKDVSVCLRKKVKIERYRAEVSGMYRASAFGKLAIMSPAAIPKVKQKMILL